MPSADPVLLEVSNLSRRFGPHEVLRGVALRVAAGQLHLVTGPNGAGKSTLLRLLAGLARPTTGSVEVEGRPVGSDQAARRAIGLLSHQTLLYHDLTPLENLTFVARLYGVPRPAEAAANALGSFGLNDAMGMPVGRLSRGTVQRVSIARCLLHSPRLLLLDEPFTGLDATAMDRVVEVLRATGPAGVGVVLVTHDVDPVWPLGGWFHVLSQGRWVLEGTVQGPAEQFQRRYREVIRG